MYAAACHRWLRAACRDLNPPHSGQPCAWAEASGMTGTVLRQRRRYWPQEVRAWGAEVGDVTRASMTSSIKWGQEEPRWL